MAIIPGTFVKWQFNPRIIVFPIPITEVSIRDLQDTLLGLEESTEGMMWPALRNTSGGEELDATTNVGLTMELQNAQVHFEARTIPLDPGTGRTCDLTDPIGEKLFVNDADFIADGIVPGHTVFNATTAEMQTIIDVVDANTLISLPLSGDGGLGWTNGDNYSVYPNIQCNITGGNLVAVDTSSETISPVFPSPNVQVVRTSSASATVTELSAIQYSSFGGGVTIDVINGTAGTEYPIGTEEFPVNNITDADTIADENGFRDLFVRGNLTITSIDMSDNHNFIGGSRHSTTFTINADANISQATFSQATVEGTLDLNNTLNHCTLRDLNVVQGIIEDCILDAGTITLGAGVGSQFLNCFSGVAGSGTPTIDMGGSGQTLAMRNYNGGIKLINKTGTESVSLDINSGQVILDSTVTNGEIVIRGISQLTDNSNGATVLTEGLINRKELTIPVWEMIYIDTNNGTAGTAFPLGTHNDPVDNLADATIIASSLNLKDFHLEGSISLSGDWSGYSFTGTNYEHASITCDGTSIIDKVTFDNVRVLGSCLSGEFFARFCVFSAGFENIYADTDDCQFTGLFSLQSNGGYLKGGTCSSQSSTVINMNGSTGGIFLADFSGVLTLQNCTDPLANIALTGHYLLNILSSCTQGVALLAGIGIVNDSSGEALTVTDRTIPNANWQQIIETGVTAEQSIRLLTAVAAGKTTIDGTTVNFRDINDTLNRVVAIMDGSERIDVTLNLGDVS
jgi:hypothetical protein